MFSRITIMLLAFLASLKHSSERGGWVVGWSIGFAFILPFLLISASSPSQEIAPISLVPQSLGITPKEFYIVDVVDDRPNKSAVAFLVLPTQPPSGPVQLQAVDLKGGGTGAVRHFLDKSLPRNLVLRPVVVRIKEFKVTEAVGARGQVDGHVEVGLVFDLVKEGKPVFMVEYKGGAKYTRPQKQLAVVEPTLRLALGDGIRYLNNWMDEVSGTSEFLARGVKVNFTDHVWNTEEDTVFYTPERQLNWDDFRARPRIGKYGASVFTSFSYEGNREVKDGFVQLNLLLKVYMLKESSYVKDSSRDAYALNHEQRHFDITKLVADRFKEKIMAADLTVDDYDSMVQYLYLESFREMNKLQERYDKETRNGQDNLAQQRWDLRLSADLKGHPIKF